MRPEHYLCFPPFRLDLVNQQLWRNEQEIPLRQKTFAVLRYLVDHPDQLVTKEALLDAVWAGTSVSDVAPGVCIQELRRALGEERQTAQFIVTVHRRGYRFIAPLTTASPVSSSKFQVSGSQSAIRNSQSAINPVGREAELSQLHRWLEIALQGQRQIVFITGEPGIGKTTLVDTFLDQIAADGSLWLGRGQCIEHYGAGEAYLPVLEALGRLCREPGGQHLITLLAWQAPTWLVQMPALLSGAELETLQRKVLGATQGRMLREMAEAVEALTAERALVLWLEDLQWSDSSTLEWLAALARRRERARLLVIGTYRPVDVIVQEHPLKAVKQELQLHGHCEELPLGFLPAAAVEEYLAGRFPVGAHGHRKSQAEAVPLQKLARVIHQRTEGNPLFMVAVTDSLVAQGVIVEREGAWELRAGIEEEVGELPQSIRQLIEKQLERLSLADQRVLEAASVAGAEFSAAAVAAGVATEVGDVEERCAALVQREQFLRASGTAEWPDGTVAARYRFLHALYQEVVYERVTPHRRLHLHRQIGERQESAYGKRAGEIAAELALHFEQGRDSRKAVQYLEQGGKNALRRSAHQEAIRLLTKGLELLKTLPETPERTQHELMLLAPLGESLRVTSGFAAPEVERVYLRARTLCQQLGESPQLFRVQQGLWGFFANRAEYPTAREVAEQLLRLAHRGQKPDSLLTAHVAMGYTLFLLGEFAPAREHLEQGSTLYHAQEHHSLLAKHQEVYSRSCAALSLWTLGYPDQASKRMLEALSLAQEANTFLLATALSEAALFHLHCKEGHTAQERAEQCIALCTEHEFASLLALGTGQRGQALARQGQVEEGMALMRQGWTAFHASGTEATRSQVLGVLAEMYGEVGRAEEGLSLLAEVLTHVDKTEERVYEAELYRIKGELTLQQFQVSGSKFQVSSTKTRNQKRETRNHSPTPGTQAEAEAEACFLKAIEIARQQQAKSWELRAAVSLARLWQQQGKKEEARTMLAEIYGWFTEGFDTKDLQEAKALLEELA
jgi:DNA-binding winged helix-turn-helix (wHTH) protein/tetratricopeptide (TPR) repeat protein